MNEKLDLRGLLCPEPVIATKKVLDKTETELVEALVDDEICVANLERLARSLKALCDVKAEAGFFAVTISKVGHDAAEHVVGHDAAKHGAAEPDAAEPDAAEHGAAEHTATGAVAERNVVPDNKRIGSVFLITREQLGEGDPEFSKTLANVFLQTMYEAGHRPRAILLANTGVKLMQESSGTRKVLEDFRAAGCDVLACGLCLDYYKLKQDVPKEQITNMFAICEYLAAAEKVLQL